MYRARLMAWLSMRCSRAEVPRRLRPKILPLGLMSRRSVSTSFQSTKIVPLALVWATRARWTGVKRLYAAVPRGGKRVLDVGYIGFFGAALAMADAVRGRNPLGRYRDDARAMRFTTDIVDWIGGYPFEVATPSETIQFAERRGFQMLWSQLVGRKHGCNEFVFRRAPAQP